MQSTGRIFFKSCYDIKVKKIRLYIIRSRSSLNFKDQSHLILSRISLPAQRDSTITLSTHVPLSTKNLTKRR